MRIERFLPAGRSVLAFCALGLAAMAVGCGDGSAASAPTEDPAAIKAQQDRERAAREAAYGKGGNTKVAPSGGVSKSPAGKSSSRPG